jgi:hypothetical protein
MSGKIKSKLNKWTEAYNGWKESGLSQKVYCKESGYQFWQFKSGIEQARQTGELERHHGKRKEVGQLGRGGNGFASIKMMESRGDEGSPYCEIRFRGQMGIRIESPEHLAEFCKLVKWGEQK